ncbi:hypothetical protein O6H91_01G106300 [Diphasiastrum complanatum]|uniref:Uncharacterized protein n=1 Tax=Diphasiastrum complanatum TaxID=34168 RepID=A0ACC2EUN6_DIPCM|nr:hypothetical protein O6H91_01G106300 [Diphasiastrum complanatum]
MKVAQLSSRKLCRPHILSKSRKAAAVAMDNPWQPAVPCPTQSQFLLPLVLAAPNISESHGTQQHSPRLNGQFTNPSKILDQRQSIATSSRVDRAASEKGGSRLARQDVSEGSKLQPERKTAGRNRSTEQDFKWGKKFKLSESCVLALHQGDITKWHVDRTTDAIVNAANERMLGGGGVDGAIHRAAGRNLLIACRNLPMTPAGVRCPVGSAVITEGFNLPVSRIIHTVGPVYKYEDAHGSILRKAYESSLTVAAEHGIKYIAFPAISCGVYGYPPVPAAEVALTAVQNHSSKFMEIHFVLFESTTWTSWLAEANRRFEKIEN